jgi:hypothetical protein
MPIAPLLACPTIACGDRLVAINNDEPQVVVREGKGDVAELGFLG